MAPLAYFRVAQRDLGLASVRYRGLLPACAMEDMGWSVSIGSAGDHVPPGANLLIAVKPLTERDAKWVRVAGSSGTPVVVDLCDNVFVHGYGGKGDVIGRRFAETASLAAAVTVPTQALRDIVISATKLPADHIFVVPDIVETPALLKRQGKLLEQPVGLAERWRRWFRGPSRIRRGQGRTLFWYGNHGAVHANFGLNDLLLFREALEQASRRHDAELWVVSNHRERFEALAPELPIRTRYFEWTPTIVDQLLASVDVCLVPNSLDPFSITKSANRALKALQAGVPVVATPTSAYAGLERATWLGDPAEGVLAYLGDPMLRQSHLREARAAIARDHSMETLRKSLCQVVRSTQERRDAPS